MMIGEGKGLKIEVVEEETGRDIGVWEDAENSEAGMEEL